MRLPSPSPPRNRRKNRWRTRTSRQQRIAFVMLLVFVCLFFLALFIADTILDTVAVKHDNIRQPRSSRGGIPRESIRHTHNGGNLTLEMTDGKRYLIFHGFDPGQGLGNVMAGLLAAQLLGHEFNRTVCVSDRFADFHLGFQDAHPEAVQNCPTALDQWFPYVRDDPDFQIRLCNYNPNPVNECKLQSRLASDTPMFTMVANTYPRWPKIPPNFFFAHYRAKKELLQILPYDAASPPKTVVHLREPDNRRGDPRPGLDEETFQSLGRLLPSDTYLVTNRVAWFDYFEKNYRWKHAGWGEIVHSGKGQSWGGRGLDPFGIQNLRQDVVTFLAGQSVQTMQMLADWYTILTAKEVYHTHSDFSISAVHFQNLPSKSIQGYNATAGKLELIDESWLVDGETERLVDRRVDGEGTSRLRECIPTSHRKKDKHNHSHNHHEHKHRHHADDNPVP